jgi:hypothetical protein
LAVAIVTDMPQIKSRAFSGWSSAMLDASVALLLGFVMPALACVDPDAVDHEHSSPARTAEPDAVTRAREAQAARTEPSLDTRARERLWSSPEDPPARSLAGATEGLAGQQYLTGNEHHLDVFAESLGRARGGGYLGIGADQAYLMIGWADPEIAWLADYDADVVAIHRVHLSFLRLAETPEAFFQLWTREGCERALARIADDPHTSLGDARARKQLADLYLANLRIIHNRLEELRGMVVANYLNDQAQYDRVRGLALADRMRPIIADLRGEVALRGIGEVARELGVELRVLYLSNAEEYWTDYGQQWRANVEALPWAEDALVLRTLLTWSRNRDYAYNIQAAANYRAWLARPWVMFVYQVVHRPVKPVLERGEIDVFETTRDPSESPADRRWRRRNPDAGAIAVEAEDPHPGLWGYSACGGPHVCQPLPSDSKVGFMRRVAPQFG